MSKIFTYIPKKYTDKRGNFRELFNSNFLKKKINFYFNIAQVNYSISKKSNTLRGLHFQKKNYKQSKIVRVIRGKIFDVVVNLNKKSKYFGTHKSFILSAQNQKILFIPDDHAHGFLTLQDNTEVEYFTTNFYSKKNELSLLWNDKSLKINWPVNKKIIISFKDSNALPFEKIKNLI
jgi:dTDP-4-dehydrorhamnose 3,5-epimerase